MDSLIKGLVYIMLLIPIGIWYVLKWVFIGIVWLVMSIIDCFRAEPYHNIDMSQVDALDGLAFEHFVANLLIQHDYKKVRVTKGSGDFGVDIFAEKEGSLVAFQCKCYQGKLGLHPIQEVYSGSQKYKADISVVVTNSYFTSAAKELANDLNVLLWDRSKLAQLMSEAEQKSI